jgi:ABC-type nitrate/sulfonate/bicarbonate transport system substrate-binding protein
MKRPHRAVSSRVARVTPSGVEAQPQSSPLAKTLATLTLFVLCLTTVAHAQSSEKTTIRQVFPSKTAAFWPNYVASAEGLYAKQNLEVENIATDPNVMISALLGGSAEAAYADSTQLMLALEKGANIVAVGLQTDRNPYKLMAAPGIKTIADLKGKKIGVASAIDIYTYVLKEVLKKGGLDPEKDVEFIVGGGQNQRLAAIQSNAVQAGWFTPPGDARLAAQGYTSLAFAPDYYPNLTLSATSVRKDWAAAHPDAMKRFLRAQSDAVKWLYNPANKARAIQVLVDQVGGTPADATEAYNYYVGKKIWPENACVQKPGLANVVKILRATGQLKTLGEGDVAKFADAEWCPA